MNKQFREACLSHWHLAQVATGDARLTQSDRLHLDTCDACRDVWLSHQAAHRVVPVGQVPAALLQELRAGRRLGARIDGVRAGIVALAAACLLMAFLPAHSAPLMDQEEADMGVQTKGSVSLLATVLRDDTFVYEDEPVEQLPRLPQGDRVRLRVVGTDSAPYLQVSIGDSHGSWTSMYQGPIPRDQWIPGGLRIVSESETLLKLRVCTSNQSNAPCEEQTFHF